MEVIYFVGNEILKLRRPNLLSNVAFSYHVLFRKEINRLNFHGQHLQETNLCAFKQRYLIGQEHIYITDKWRQYFRGREALLIGSAVVQIA